jgi:hypothetical protein
MGKMMWFPIMALSAEGIPLHTVLPAQACHLVSEEYHFFHPNEQTFQIGWELTDEDLAAGKTGTAWVD